MMSFSLDYEFAQKVYSVLRSSAPTFWSLQIFKTIGGICLISVWYSRFLDWKTLGKDDPLYTKNDYVKGVIFILILGSYDFILQFVDWFFTLMEQEAFATNIAVQEREMRGGDIAVNADCDWMCSMVMIRDILLKFVTDLFWPLLLLLESCSWLIDACIYCLFLLQRFFLMYMLQIIGVCAFCVYPFEKARIWFWKWIGTYVGVFLTLIPYIVINMFTNIFYNTAHAEINKIYQPEAEPEGLVFYAPDSAPLIILLILVTIFKLWMYKLSTNLVLKIFN